MKVLMEIEKKLRACGDIVEADNLQRVLKILKMCADDKVFWSPYDWETDTFESANPVFLTGDAFGNGDDDGEQILITDVDKLWKAYEPYGYEGGLAWVASKRAYAPTPEYRTPAYTAARKLLTG